MAFTLRDIIARPRGGDRLGSNHCAKYFIWLVSTAWLLSGLLLQARQPAAAIPPTLHAPAGNRPTRLVSRGEGILPNGRLITPLGRQIKVDPHPYGIALSPDGKILVTVNSGTSPFSASVITALETSEPRVTRLTSGSPAAADDDLESVWMGAAIAPDNRTLYLSEGENGRVGVFDLVSAHRLASLDLDGVFEGREYRNSLTGSIQTVS